MTTDMQRPLALVTGASSGIGYELAKQFANNGFDLVVTAEDDGVAKTAREVEALDARAEVVQVDLARGAGVEELWERVRVTGRPLAAAALNAGRGAGGAFATETQPADELEI